MKCRYADCKMDTHETFCAEHEPLPAMLITYAQVLRDSMAAAVNPSGSPEMASADMRLIILAHGVEAFLAAVADMEKRRGRYSHSPVLGEQPGRL